MQIYTVQVDPLSSAADRGAVLVREAFCWPAAVFTVFWALYHRLWGWALILLVLGGALGVGVVELGLDPISQAAVQSGFMELGGFNANDWRRRRFARRGYVLADVAAGADLARAEQRFFDRQAATPQ